MKAIFDKKAKQDVFQEGYLVLKWDARREEKAKHGKFDNLSLGPFYISQVLENNTFMLHNLDGEHAFRAPVNGRFLKLFYKS